MARRKSSRRAFLAGQSALDAIGDLGLGDEKQPLPLPAFEAKDTDPTYLVTIARSAMACEFEVILNLGQYADGPERAAEALDLVDQIESQLTVYRDGGEVMEINRRAATEPVAMDRQLYRLLERAQQLSALTEGAFDITSGPLSKVWGFYRRQGAMPSAAEVSAALELVGFQGLQLLPEYRIRLQKPGMELNLGAIGKGYALDRAAASLHVHGISDFLLHGGNSSVLASGKRRRSESSPGWTVALKHPLRPQERLAEFHLVDQALGTSGSGTQFFHHQGKRYGHILDPRSGWPADKVLSATVIAPSAEQADALSTACYVLGIEGALRICTECPGLSALLVTANSGGKAELHPVNMEAVSWRLC